MQKYVLLLLVLILWIAPEIISVYFIMPIGGSQEWDMFNWSYFFTKNIWIFRFLFGTLFFLLARKLWLDTEQNWPKFLLILLLLIYAGTFYMTNHVMKADKIFHQPTNKSFVNKSKNIVPLDRLVLGVGIEDNAKAYPIQYLAYHHQVVDSIDKEPIIVTYCSVCRTGRVFSSKINGVNETFRLVGMSQWNAMFEDKTTGSWWQQTTGEAIIGPLKGTVMDEIMTQQVTLGEWLDQYPQSLIMKPDTIFHESYSHYEDFEDGSVEGTLTRYDSLSWKEKSWIVGIEKGNNAIAYDWNELKAEKLIQNSFEGSAILLLLGRKDKSFRAWDRTVGNRTLDFMRNDSTNVLMDIQTLSTWADHGECLSGEMKGTQLKGIQAYQQYWHSWQDFHPNTSQYPQ